MSIRRVALAQGYADAEASSIQILMGESGLATSAGITASGHWLWAGSAGIETGKAEVEAFANQGHAVAAEIDAAAPLITARATYIHTAKAAISSGIELVPDAVATRMACTAIDVTCLATASPIGNPAALDPAERTMRRSYTDRTMRRPYTDRTMKATRA